MKTYKHFCSHIVKYLSGEATQRKLKPQFTFNEACGWLGLCATSRKVADSVPDGVIGIFH